MPFLVVRDSSGRRVHELGESSTIGRSHNCALQLDDPLVSTRHAEIVLSQGHYLLKDLHSTNGTLINAQRLIETTTLQDGDEISIGGALITFTRTAPPQASQSDAADLASALPKGTVIIPVERFGLHAGQLGQTLHAAAAASETATWLRSLCNLLREAHQCASEDELWALTTRVLSAALPAARVRVLLESAAKDGHTHLRVWNDPKLSRSTRIDRPLSLRRDELLRYAAQQCVAVLSPDLAHDQRLGTQSEGPASATHENISVIVAPVICGKATLAYVSVERAYRVNERGHGLSPGPFAAAHLEFVAAATYPLAVLLANLRRTASVLSQNERLRKLVTEKHAIVGNSEPLKACLSLIERVAPFDTPVLILGESGTGKELAARAIHSLSPRRDGPFEAINCGALPESLIESELFGHIKGAFTGASANRAGCFEVACGGTLFLDEVAELPHAAQAKLLRVLQESKLARVGESRLRDIDCRIIAATNRELLSLVRAGKFREDLYFRLNVMDLTLPPLRQRLEDLPLLCEHILRTWGHFSLTSEVLAVFRRYAWPGNIRELRNVLERMAILARPKQAHPSEPVALTLADVPRDVQVEPQPALGAAQRKTTTLLRNKQTAVLTPPTGRTALLKNSFVVPAPERPSVKELQVRYARWVLECCRGNRSKAAKILGIQRATLYAWTDEQEKPGSGA